MSRIKNHTSKILLPYLIKNFSHSKFTVLDLKKFAEKNNIPAKALTYSAWWLCDRNQIVKVGEKLNQNGGSPINIYEVSESNRRLIHKPRDQSKTEKELKEKNAREAANRLDLHF